MAISPLSAKEQWLADQKTAEAWAIMVADPVFKKALTYAIAHYACSGPEAPEIRGAIRLADALVQLSEKQPVSTFPGKQLKNA